MVVGCVTGESSLPISPSLFAWHNPEHTMDLTTSVHLKTERLEVVSTACHLSIWCSKIVGNGRGHLLGKCMEMQDGSNKQTSNGLIYLKESGNYPARGRTQSTGAGL